MLSEEDRKLSLSARYRKSKKKKEEFKSAMRDRVEAINNRPMNGWKWTSKEQTSRMAFMHLDLVARRYVNYRFDISDREIDFLMVFSGYEWYVPQDLARLVGCAPRWAMRYNNKFIEKGWVEYYPGHEMLYGPYRTFCLSEAGYEIADTYHGMLAGQIALPKYSDFAAVMPEIRTPDGNYVDLKVRATEQNRETIQRATPQD